MSSRKPSQASKQPAKPNGSKPTQQSLLSFGQQRLGLKKLADIENESAASKKRQEPTPSDQKESLIELIEPTSTKKSKLEDGHSQRSLRSSQKSKTPKEELKSTSECTPQQQIESKSTIPDWTKLPPKNIDKLKALSDPKYDPIEDATFHKGQPIPFAFIAKALGEIEKIKGQNSKDAIKEIIANVFRSAILLKPDEFADLFYFFCVKLAPDYEGLETGIGHELLLKAVAVSCGKSAKQIRDAFKEEGDLGIVVQQGKTTQNTLGAFFSKKAEKQALSFRTIFDSFKKIGRTSGNNSQTEKEKIMVNLIRDASNEESKYIVRWLQKNLKTGAAEKTFISALARAIAYSPPNKNTVNAKKALSDQQFAERCALIEYGINEAICEFPNYGEIINTLLVVGDDMSKLKDKCHIRVGIPVKPMLAKPTKGVREVLDRFEQLKFTCEYKYDGFRGQIHFDKSKPDNLQVQIYSRNLENLTGTYPDIVDFIKKSARQDVSNFILDSELVAYDTVNDRILPFQVLTQRSKKNVTEEDLKTKICICAFDLLYLNGQSLLKKPFIERRETLHSFFKEIQYHFVFAKYKDAEAFEDIEEFLNDSVKNSCEGLMIKTLEVNATYEPSKRSLNWLKLKKDYMDSGFGDSLDLVVVGADWGKGKRVGMFGSFLLACYDENLEQLQTVTKMATGLTDEMLAKAYAMLKDLVVDKPPSNLRYKEKNVDVWLMPRYVWEIKCADLSVSPMYCAAMGMAQPDKGIALRFPRFIREREDKTIETATTSEQILDYFNSQPQQLAKEGGDDDYDF